MIDRDKGDEGDKSLISFISFILGILTPSPKVNLERRARFGLAFLFRLGREPPRPKGHPSFVRRGA